MQELLDARVDPLADSAVQEWLLRDTEAMERVVALRARLLALPAAQPLPAAPQLPAAQTIPAAQAIRARERRRAAVVAAAAAALVLAAVATWWRARSARPELAPGLAPRVAPLAAPPLAHGHHVRALTYTVDLVGDDASCSVSLVDHAHVSERRARWTTNPDARVVSEVCSLDAILR